ncbi:MAG: hypothetical protein P8179_23530, partial [Candidatus Thiodiazotropha sp.]
STPTMDEVSADSATYHVISSVTATGVPAINTGSFGGAVAAGNRAMDNKASAVTAALTARTIMGSYITSGNYATDWIVTFPTRYTKVSDNAVEPARAPFTNFENPTAGQACHVMSFDYWNREEEKNPIIEGGVGIMGPPPPASLVVCYEVNVAAINDSGEIDGFSATTSSKAVKISSPLESQFSDGWISLNLSSYTATPAAGSVPAVVTGLPVLSFSAIADTVSGIERGGVFASRITVDEQ